MKIIIRRGAQEIGGTVIEIQSKNSRILLEAGYPLFLSNNAVDGEISFCSPDKLLELGILPNIKGLYRWDTPTFDGILISHAHMDHYGLIDCIHPDIPVYLSKGTHKLIDLSSLFLGTSRVQGKFFEFNMYEPFQIKDLRIMPFLMDHSAFDAAAFEISDKEKVIIYTGDFRGHGRKPICLERFIKRARKKSDLLFIEGTVLGRPEEEMPTEQKLEDWLTKEIAKVQGPALFQSSSQNIDRLVSFYKAAIRLNKTFVIDIYTANILYELRKLGNNKLPYPSREYKNIKVFYTYLLTKKIYDKLDEKYAKRFSSFYISKNMLKLKQDHIVMLVRPSMRIDIEKTTLKGGLFIYSLWDGYSNSEYQKEFELFLANVGFITKKIHTSGHAEISDIKKVVAGLKPKRIVPIHTMKPELYKEMFGEVSLKTDGEIFCL